MSNPVSSIRIKNFLNGEWVEETGVDYVPLFNPSTGAQIGEVPLSNPDTSLKAVESAYAAYDSWRNLSVNKRVSYLYDIRQAMIDKEEDLAVAIAVDQAKHVSEARGEVQRVVQIIETACSIPTLIQGESLDHIAGNINGRVIKSPLGVFCGVAPFNFPALVFSWFIPFAIGVGNTFVFKPSTQSPYFMQKMGDIFNDVGLPKGVINIIHGNRTVVQPWYEDSRVSGVCLVGSTPTAKKKIERYIEIGVKEGSNLVIDGRNPKVPEEFKSGYYVGPTIFIDVTPDMTIYKEEIFGPVVSIVKVNCIDTVIGLIRDQEFGNGACIFTQNLYYTEKFINQADVGMVGVNVGIPAPHPYLPFGGIKDSHLGTDKVQGKDGVDFFTQNKIATIRFAPPTGRFTDESGKEMKDATASKGVRSCVAQ